MALGVTVAEIDKILKLDYQGPIREQLINKNILLSILKKDYSRGSFQGLKSVIPVHTGRNIGRGWRAEDAIIPFPGKQSHDQMSFHMAYLYGRIGITGQSIAQSRNDKGSFARALDLELKGLVTDMAITMQKAVWSDASGRLSDLRGAGTTHAGTLAGYKKADANVNNTNQNFFQVNSDRWLEVGQPVFIATRSGVASATGSKQNFLTATDGTCRIKAIFAQDGAAVAGTHDEGLETAAPSSTVFAREGYTVELENYTPSTGITLGTPVVRNHTDTDIRTCAHQYSLYAHGSRGAPTTVTSAGTAGVPVAATTASTAWTKPQEIWGLHALVSDENPSAWTDADSGLRQAEGLVGEKDRTDVNNSWFKTNTIDASGASIDQHFDKFQEAYDVSEIEGDFTPGAALTSYRIRRAMAALLIPERRFGSEKELAAGWTGLQFNNSVILCDKDACRPGDERDAPALDANATWFNDVFFLTRNNISWQVMEDMSWEDTGGTIIREGVGAQARDRYEAWMKAYWNLICVHPRSHTKLSGVRFARTPTQIEAV